MRERKKARLREVPEAALQNAAQNFAVENQSCIQVDGPRGDRTQVLLTDKDTKTLSGRKR